MTDKATPVGVGSSATLGLDSERDAVLAQLDDRTNQTFNAKRKRWAALVRAQDAEIKRAWAERDAAVTNLEAHAEAEVQRAVAAERERCAKPVPDEWLVKVRRLVDGFEHVSGIARLWEPDYSSGSERALWSRATEACADVAKLLRDAEGPNAI